MATTATGTRLDALLRGLPVLSVRGATDRAIAGLAYDSRQVRKGFLFVAVPGAQQDGLRFVDEAVERGAAAVVTQSPTHGLKESTHVQVADARQALAELACAFYRHPSAALKVVGVTGTNGKTTVTFLLRNILAEAGLSPGLLGTVQYEVGARVIPASRTTPESLDLQAFLDQMRSAGCRSAVMEVSSHALALDRVRGIDFDAAVFTNLTRDHLDFHKTTEQYFVAKKRLFDALGRGAKPAVAAINVDDRHGRRLLASGDLAAPAFTYGFSRDAQVRASGLTMDNAGSTWSLASPWATAPARITLAGRYNVLNALAAFTAACALGVAPDRALAVLARPAVVPGRLEEIPTGRGFRVFVDYAHTDDALGNVLKTLRRVTRGRLLVVFGCGGDRDRTKRPLMGAKAARLADFSVLTSDNPRKEDPREILEQIRAGFGAGTRYETIEDRALAIQRALQLARPEDVVLIAGKGHESFQEFANRIVPFDDRQVARHALDALPR
jgi:UDP-N-acetylmuramoyl-L-alanyl-D-glutamate--2,6-diaminopimelate ligase